MSRSESGFIEAAIDRLGDRGDGVIETEDGPIFALGALPGERVAGRLAAPPDGARRELRLHAVSEPSPSRRPPPCPHAEACGGCALQHADDAFVAAWKRQRVVDALARRGLETDVAATATAPPRSRRRAAFSLRRTKSDLVLGFHEARSDRITAFDACMVLRPALVTAAPALRRLGRLAAPRKRPIKIMATASDAGLDIVVEDAKALDLTLRGEAAAWAEETDVARLSWNGEVVALRRPPEQRFGRAVVAPPPGGFLQAAAEGEALILEEVRRAVADARRVADLYCGSGAFSLPLAETAEVRAYDADAAAVAALDRGWRRAEGLRRLTAQARDLDRRPLLAAEFDGVEAIVFDPPRAGAPEQTREIARADASVVVGVSCNPATFARDARTLVDAGWRLERAAPIDQFRWSAHVELVGVFRR